MRFQAVPNLILAAIAFALSASNATAQTFLPVGNINNPNDTSGIGPAVGAVPYGFSIAQHELTNAEYVEFLNTKATAVLGADTIGLFNPLMASNNRGGITRTGAGTIGSPYAYASKTNMSNKPVNFVSWFDAIRYANWVNNGKGSADTESGSYTLLGGTAVPTNASTITRNPTAAIVIPTENEWYKAAYFEPGASGNSYWLYGTRSDSIPVEATATVTGDIANPGANVVNYDYNTIWNGETGNVTSVGSAGLLSRSFYGAFDMTGNVYEWTETLSGLNRVMRGGSFGDGELFMRATTGGAGFSPSFEEDPAIGFRIAAVPELHVGWLLLAGMLGLGYWFYWRKRSRLAVEEAIVAMP